MNLRASSQLGLWAMPCSAPGYTLHVGYSNVFHIGHYSTYASMHQVIFNAVVHRMPV